VAIFVLLSFVLGLLISPFKSCSRLEAENAALRQQLEVLFRKHRGRVYSIVGFPLRIVQLDTLVRWHRHGLPVLALEEPQS
jgi:hypothetical protein